jgi:hypothetical protein
MTLGAKSYSHPSMTTVIKERQRLMLAESLTRVICGSCLYDPAGALIRDVGLILKIRLLLFDSEMIMQNIYLGLMDIASARHNSHALLSCIIERET